MKDHSPLQKIQLILTLAALGLVAGCSKDSNFLSPNPTPYVRITPTEYYLYLPSQYAPNREWPLFVGIHGFSGDGTNCLQMWQSYSEREGFVLLCPSLGEEHGGWYVDQGEASLQGILRQVQKDCRVQKRFFLAGFSAGAEFVQAYAFDHHRSVTGVAVLSAGNYYEPVPAARNIPFLVVIGDQDDPISLENAELFTNSLKQAGFTVEADILPGIKHEVSVQALDLTIRLYRRIYGPHP